MSRSFVVVCVSRQEWDVELPTNRQQMMVRAAARGHEVLFVESGGHVARHLWRLLRGPQRRSMWRRLASGEQVAPLIRVRKAIVLAPWGQKFELMNRINARLTAALLRARLRKARKSAVLWLYDPSAFELVDACGEVFALYDCVDDYAEQVGFDARRRRVVAAADAEAARRADVVVVTTLDLAERQRARNPETHLVGNGADFDHFSGIEPGGVAPEVASLPRPLVGFAGSLTPRKLDFLLLDEVAAVRPDWTFVLVGPATTEAAPSVERLAARRNVVWLGPRTYAELPRYVAAFDVAVIPYAANDYTRNCSPLKVYEYLAAGKPVVASGVPSLAGMEPDVVLADGPEAFLAAVANALVPAQNGALRRRRALAAANTLDRRAARILELVSERLGA